MDPTPATDMHHHGDDARRLEELVFAFAAAAHGHGPATAGRAPIRRGTGRRHGPDHHRGGPGGRTGHGPVRTRPGAGLCVHRPSPVPGLRAQRGHGGRHDLRPGGGRQQHLRRFVDGGGRRRARREPGPAVARRPGRHARGARAAPSCPVDRWPTCRRWPWPGTAGGWRRVPAPATGPAWWWCPTPPTRRSRPRSTSSTWSRSRWAPTHAGRLRPDEMDAATRDRLEATAPRVAAVVGSAGLTNSGGVDDLAGLADLAASLGAWFHVDAAYGGGALCSPTDQAAVRRDRAGRLAHHRPPQVAVRPLRLRRHPVPAPRGGPCHLHPAGRLPGRRSPRATTGTPATTRPHLSRRARGLPFWFSVAVHGTDAYREAVEGALDVTAATADLVAGSDHLELVMEPELSVVLFRRIGWTDRGLLGVVPPTAGGPGGLRGADPVAGRDGAAPLRREPPHHHGRHPSRAPARLGHLLGGRHPSSAATPGDTGTVPEANCARLAARSSGS